MLYVSDVLSRMELCRLDARFDFHILPYDSLKDPIRKTYRLLLVPTFDTPLVASIISVPRALPWRRIDYTDQNRRAQTIDNGTNRLPRSLFLVDSATYD